MFYRVVNNTEIEIGTFIYFLLIRCNVKDLQLFSFYKNLVEGQNLPSVVQATKNNIDSAKLVENRKYLKSFFKDLLKILDLELGNLMFAMLTSAQLRDQDLLNLDNNMTLADVTSGFKHVSVAWHEFLSNLFLHLNQVQSL